MIDEKSAEDLAERVNRLERSVKAQSAVITAMMLMLREFVLSPRTDGTVKNTIRQQASRLVVPGADLESLDEIKELLRQACFRIQP